jgi:hypothetical protein
MVGNFVFCVEAKCVEGWTIEGAVWSGGSVVWKWWEQAVRQAASVSRRPMLVFSRNRAPIFVMLEQGVVAWSAVQNHPPVLYARSPRGCPVAVLALSDLFRVLPPEATRL